MTGYMVPELWCNVCDERVQAEGETSLTALRANVGDSGWCSHFAEVIDRADPGLLSDLDRREWLVDICPDCECPVCGEER